MMHEPAHGPASFWRSRSFVTLLVLGAIAGFFLLTEHRAHVLGVLPYLLILACPLMHLFMHHGHGHGHGHEGHPHPASNDKPPREKSDAR